MKKLIYLLALCLVLSSCLPVQSALPPAQSKSNHLPSVRSTIRQAPNPVLLTAGSKSQPSSASVGRIPTFDHIILIMLENHSYSQVIGSQAAPFINQLAQQNVLFTHFYAVAHPSLPNYIALASGSTYGIHNDCLTCYLNQPSLADRIEASGRTWKSYQEGLPAPCYVGNAGRYTQLVDPFIYFNSIRTDPARCKESIVPLTQLDTDLQMNQLPNFALIVPNLCDSGHSCKLSTSDQWLKQMTTKLENSPALGTNYAIFILYDESVSSDSSSCCALGSHAGGHITALLISPQAKSGYQDPTPLSHYSLVKTILLSWDLPALGLTSQNDIQPITSPFK